MPRSTAADAWEGPQNIRQATAGSKGSNPDALVKTKVTNPCPES